MDLQKDNCTNTPIGLFSFNGRCSRRDFVKVWISILFFSGINAFYFVPRGSVPYGITVLVITYIFFFAFLPMTVRRLHDSNFSGTFVLIEFLPNLIPLFKNPVIIILLGILSGIIGIFYLCLILRIGDVAENKYGVPNPPTSYSTKTVNSICISILLLTVLLGILSICKIF